MLKRRNILADIPTDLPEELFDKLAGSDNVRIERIVSKGHATGQDQWYDQDLAEFVVVIKGTGTLRFEACDETIVMRAGDYIDIPANTRHRVESTAADSETVWLAVHYR